MTLHDTCRPEHITIDIDYKVFHQQVENYLNTESSNFATATSVAGSGGHNKELILLTHLKYKKENMI